MSIPKSALNEIEGKLKNFCDDIPEHVKDKLRYDFKTRGNSVTLIERRPYFQNPDIWTHLPIAQFRYNPDTRSWKLFAADRNSKWHDYSHWNVNWDDSPGDFDRLLEEVEADPTGIFWG